MAQFVVRRPITGERRQRARLGRLRYQLLGCILLAIGLPFAVGLLLIPRFETATQTYQALAGSLLAITSGLWFYCSVSRFPGIQASSYILPAFGLTYGIVLTIFLAFRLEYNRLLLGAGFLITVAWFYAIAVWLQRRRQLRIGVVQGGDVEELVAIPDVEWIPLDKTSSIATEAVVADLRVKLSDDWNRRLTEFALTGGQVYHVKQLQESLTGRVELDHLSENSLGSLAPPEAYFQLKDIVDRVAAAMALVVLAPLFLVVALLVRLDDKGPAFFTQTRIGYRGRAFRVIKFRTMRTHNALAHDPKRAAQTQHNDERITRFGKFLRKSRIDELPQLLNVVRGEMSWIGPRPEAIALSEWYEREIPFYRYRHIVKPGITGWAQVNQGHVVDVADITDKLHYDFYYIKMFSPWIDMLIVAKTIQTMLTGFGHR